MTNNEIIFENVRASFTPAQLAELVQAAYTAEQIAARRANVAITVDEGSADTAEDIFTAMLAAEIIAARWAEVDGLTATIKGATTAAPVVWLAGDTKPHEKEIEAAGGKWSGKKNAYYFRVA